MLGCSSFLVVTCTSSSPTPRKSLDNLYTSDEYGDEYGEEYDAEEDETFSISETIPKDSFGLAHPKRANAFETNRLIMMSTDRPSDEDLQNCFQQISAVSRESLSGSALVEASDLLRVAIQKDATSYHWCFYGAMGQMDRSLSNEEFSLVERYDQFLATMKTLWILARALDKNRGDSTYFTYLRSRYLEISKEHFARPLEVMKEPLGGTPGERPGKHFPESRKPAREFNR